MHPPLVALRAALQDTPRPEVAAALCRLLKPVLDYDARTRSDLLRTLRTYLESGSLADTAERLFLHRNSVLYRIQRIETLASLDLRHRQTRLLLLVAFALTDPPLLDSQGDSP